MAYTTIDKPDDYFNTKLYTGDGNSTQAVTGVGFQPDWIWIKNRTDAHWHNLNDSVRGAGAGQVLRSNTNAAEGGTSGHVSSFDSDGFTVATGTSDAEEVNTSSDNYVSWNWLAGTTSGIPDASKGSFLARDGLPPCMPSSILRAMRRWWPRWGRPSCGDWWVRACSSASRSRIS